MQVVVHFPADGGPPGRALRRLLCVLGRFAPEVLTADLRGTSTAGGRVMLSARVTFAGGGGLALQAEDEPSVAAMEHFVDRLGRAVARRLAPQERR